MSDDFTTLRNGLAYCQEKTRELEAAQDAFAARHLRLTEIPDGGTPADRMHALMNPPAKPAHILSLHVRPPTGNRSGELWATLDEDLPDRLAREAGGILNEVRAQLDHLANILARRNGANSDEASWPIVDSEDQLTGQAKKNVKRAIRQLSEADQERVLATQPLARPELGDLSHLHAADIFRKHKRPVSLRAHAHAAASGGTIGQMMREPRPDPLVARGDRTRISIFRDCTTRFDLTGGLVVEEPANLRGVGVIALLDGCRNAVETIINEFA